MFSHKSLIAALCLALAAPLAAARPGHGPGLPPEYDLDGDGTITKEEIQTARTAEFTAIDTDKDGYASAAELKTWLEAKQATDFNKKDSDQNGLLSKEEFVAGATGREARRAAKAFKFGDSDGDGALSLAEFKALKPVTQDLVRIFDILDSNDDDQISKDEYLTPPTPPSHNGQTGGGALGQGMAPPSQGQGFGGFGGGFGPGH